MSVPEIFRPRNTMVPLALALAQGLVCAPAAAATEAERITQLEHQLAQSMKLVEQMNQRMQQMEAALARAVPAPASSAANASAAAPVAAAPAPGGALAAKVNDLEQQVSAMANRPEEDHGLDVHGFGDVGFAVAGTGHSSGGNVGALDFYLTPKFGDRVKTLFELNFEVDNEGHEGVDLERIQVGYLVNDALTVWGGRFHTPFGYWNTAFHHGAQLQTSILRPMFLDFEDAGGILPAHTVGLLANGTMRTDGGRLGYDAYVGNAPTIQMGDPATPASGELDPGLLGAGARAATFGINVNYAFRGAADGLSIGVHALTSDVSDNANVVNTTRLLMYGGWAAYLEDGWEVLGELYGFHNKDRTGGSGTHTSHAAYAQVGRQIGSWTPFARYEVTSLDQNDPYFAQQISGQSYKRVAAGVRYDLNPRTAVKLEAQRTRLTDRAVDSYSELRGQLAVRF